MGRTPLFYAIRYDAPPGVVGLLLHVDPSAVLKEDQNADSPLALIWDSWAEKLEGKRVVNSFLPGGFPEPEDQTVEERALILRARLQRDAKLRSRWDKANMLLRAAFGFSVDDDSEEEESGRKQEVQEPGQQAAVASTSSSSKIAASASSSASVPPDVDANRKWRIVHATAAVKCHLSLFLLACALHPEQVQEIDEFDLRRPGDPCAPDLNPRQTALHLAASSNSGGEPGKTVLLTLLSQFREAASIADGIDDSLPLHRMVENPKKKDWTNHAAILYRFYPRAVQIPDRNGKLPLHRAAAAVISSDNTSAPSDEENVILQLLRVFPQAASHADLSGLLPLHSLASVCSSWDSGIEAVYNIHRNAVLVRAGPRHHHRLPLHLASASLFSRESLLSRLLLHHPRAASMPDGLGKLPFFLACEAGKSWDEGGTRCLYAAHPGAVCLPEDNPRGWLPLHAAASAPLADADLLAHLVELHPPAASTADSQGRYPLHLACLAGKSWTLGGISVLFDADPSPMSVLDARGRLPFHCAALVHCRARQSRVVGSPDFYEHEDDDEEEGGCDDLALTERERAARKAEEAAHVDILFNLLRADPTVLEGASA
jgi:ankyrin repeat protein